MANPVAQGIGVPFIPPVPPFGLGQQLIVASENSDEEAIQNILRHPQAIQIPANLLGQAFIICIQKRLETCCSTIFNLPNAQHIPGNGAWGLGRALIETVQQQDADSLQLIQGHPNFINIEANGEYGLGQALKTYIQTLIQERNTVPLADPNPAYLNAIILHPHATQTQFDEDIADSIGDILLIMAVQSEQRFNNDDQGIVFALLHRNISHLIQPNGEFGLGRVLLNAAWATTPFIVDAILLHPRVLEITSDQTDVDDDETEVERDCSIGCFGFSEAIFAAVNNGNPSINNVLRVRDQSQIVMAFFNFVTGRNIRLDANGPLGLADSLTSAAEEEDSALLVPLILSFPGSSQIVANADEEHGGLSSALFNAAVAGYADAIRSILNHPNAHSIIRQNLQDAHGEAVTNGHDDAARLIFNFMNNK